jgi:hypothetical protein
MTCETRLFYSRAENPKIRLTGLTTRNYALRPGRLVESFRNFLLPCVSPGDIPTFHAEVSPRLHVNR